jgi:hypothetical protein
LRALGPLVRPAATYLPSAQRAFQFVEPLVEIVPAILLGSDVLDQQRFFGWETLNVGAYPGSRCRIESCQGVSVSLRRRGRYILTRAAEGGNRVTFECVVTASRAKDGGIVMSKVLLRCASVLIMVVIIAAFPRANPKPEAARACSTLVGTWRLVTAKYGGSEYSFPAGTTTVKHVTPAQFLWASYGTDGNITRAAGGGYTLNGETYQETPEYGLSTDFGVIRGKAQTFTCRIDGNKWYHNGSLSNGQTIEEVWDRVEAK